MRLQIKELKMAKKKKPALLQIQRQVDDRTPIQRLQADWKTDRKKLSPYITERGVMRGGLGLSDQAKARKIIEDYGL